MVRATSVHTALTLKELAHSSFAVDFGPYRLSQQSGNKFLCRTLALSIAVSVCLRRAVTYKSAIVEPNLSVFTPSFRRSSTSVKCAASSPHRSPGILFSLRSLRSLHYFQGIPIHV